MVIDFWFRELRSNLSLKLSIRGLREVRANGFYCREFSNSDMNRWIYLVFALFYFFNSSISIFCDSLMSIFMNATWDGETSIVFFDMRILLRLVRTDLSCLKRSSLLRI